MLICTTFNSFNKKKNKCNHLNFRISKLRVFQASLLNKKRSTFLVKKIKNYKKSDTKRLV
jgi:hypothetical protein